MGTWPREYLPEFQLATEKVIKSQYSKVSEGEKYFVTANMRVIYEIDHGELLLPYMTPSIEGVHEKRHTVKITTNRAIGQ